jgi:hypothetical protein
MAYTINLTDGSIFATIADGTINTSSSMVLVGKNYAGYGEFLDENFIHLLENGANTTPPGAPLTGQLWWDKTNNVMKVYNGTTFKVISASTAAATQPTSNVAGDLWFDTVNQQLKVYNGANFILVGPASSAGEGTSGAIVTTITDNLAVDHVVIQLYVQNVLVGLISKDPTFTPVPAISGFATVSPGIQLSTTVSSVLFRGTATNSQTLDSLNSTQFLRSDTNDTTSGTLGILNDTGFTVGLDQDAKISVNTITSEITLQNQTQDANLSLKVNDGGAVTTVFFANGATGEVSIPTTVTATGNVTAPYFIGNVIGGISGNIGAPGNTTQVIYNDTGLLAASSSFTFNSSTNALTVAGNISGGNLYASGGITSTESLVKIGGNGVGNIGQSTNTFNTVFSANGVFTAASVESITKTGANGIGNIGSSTSVFNTVFAKATSAQYADVAERFAADEVLEAGTVVELGGPAEITRSTEELSESVFGVISTRAAYLMNSAAGDDETHPPVAMTGRVPVKVKGTVQKGDRLVSAGEGMARAAKRGEATPFNTIGRALEDKTTNDIGMVEAIVTIK